MQVTAVPSAGVTKTASAAHEAIFVHGAGLRHGSGHVGYARLGASEWQQSGDRKEGPGEIQFRV